MLEAAASELKRGADQTADDADRRGVEIRLGTTRARDVAATHGGQAYSTGRLRGTAVAGTGAGAV